MNTELSEPTRAKRMAGNIWISGGAINTSRAAYKYLPNLSNCLSATSGTVAQIGTAAGNDRLSGRGLDYQLSADFYSPKDEFQAWSLLHSWEWALGPQSLLNAVMSGRLRRQLRCCFLGVLVLLALDVVFVLMMGSFDPVKELMEDESSWHEIIAHTPDQSDAFYQYNRQLSDKLPLVRLLPETRHERCNRHGYKLPLASRAQLSVVISFHNEARSMLLRTVETLIQRTPKDYLLEVILIDDGSVDAGLLPSIITEARQRPRIICRRHTHRRGTIWSRNEGARLAGGDYLLFLDSHCEVNDGWLEPLLERLDRNPKLAVSPLLDPIEPQTLRYLTGNEMLKGGFDWSLHFHWLPRVLRAGERPEQPFNSSGFAGGILMISRDWFQQLHGFNPHLETWGGESIELAIKLWLCGGQIEIVPCSRIGHIFRPRHAFEFPLLVDQEQPLQLDSAQATYLRNSKIIAESWLDEYKYLFYALRPAARQIPLNLQAVHSYDPRQIRTERRCESFDWLLRHVSPELSWQHANISARGSLRNGGRCLHVTGSLPRLQLQLNSCDGLQVTQWHLHHGSGQLSTETQFCLAVAVGEKQPHLILDACRPNEAAQHWLRRRTQLQHARTHLCLDNPLRDQVSLSHCRPYAVSQSFQFALEMEALG